MVTRQHLVQYHSTAVLVAARINNAIGLLRRHISYCASHCNCSAGTLSWFKRASNAKIGNYQAAILLVYEDILRLDIAMNNRARPRMGVV